MPELSQENIFIWVVVGGMFGWIADAAFEATRFGAVGNIIVGIVGAFLGALVSDALGIRLPVLSPFYRDLLVAFIGAIALLAVVASAERASR